MEINGKEIEIYGEETKTRIQKGIDKIISGISISDEKLKEMMK